VTVAGRPGPGRCDLWRVPVRPRPGWWGLLDDTERARARRLAGSPAQDVLVTSRGAQRLVAARYLGTEPATVTVARDCAHCGDPAHGRPRLAGADLDWSVSHTDRWLLIAVVGAGLVGVDIEGAAPTLDVDGLARATLTDVERRAWTGLPGPARRTGLLRAWTRKEAAMKLTGLGLRAPANQVDVHGATARAGLPGWPADPIHLRDLPAPPGHVAALASTVPTVEVVWRELTGPERSVGGDLDGVLAQRRPVGPPGLHHQAGDVLLHGARGDVQPAGDGLVGQPGLQQLEDLVLAQGDAAGAQHPGHPVGAGPALPDRGADLA
jgi:4'-phosphopantetheinyl transferase